MSVAQSNRLAASLLPGLSRKSRYHVLEGLKVGERVLGA